MADLPVPGTVIESDFRYILLDNIGPAPRRHCDASYMCSLRNGYWHFGELGGFSSDWPIVEPTANEQAAFAYWCLTGEIPEPGMFTDNGLEGSN